jgi:hypothetical protein
MKKKIKMLWLFFAVALSICFVKLLNPLLLCYIRWVEGPRYVNGIYAPDAVYYTAYGEHGIDYRKLLKKAINNDADAIRTIASLTFGGKSTSAFVYHGIAMIDLIELIEEDNFTPHIKTLSEKQILYLLY